MIVKKDELLGMEVHIRIGDNVSEGQIVSKRVEENGETLYDAILSSGKIWCGIKLEDIREMK